MNKIKYEINEEQAWEIYMAVKYNNYLEDAECWCQENDADIQNPKMFALMADYVIDKHDSTLSHWDNFQAAYDYNHDFYLKMDEDNDVTMEEVRKKYVFTEDARLTDSVDMADDGKENVYDIMIEEKYRRVEQLIAPSAEEALSMIEDMYCSEEITLDRNCFENVEYSIIRKK